MWTIWASRAHSDQLLKEMCIKYHVSSIAHCIRFDTLTFHFILLSVYYFQRKSQGHLKQPISSQKLYTPLINSVDQLDSGSGAD